MPHVLPSIVGLSGLHYMDSKGSKVYQLADLLSGISPPLYNLLLCLLQQDTKCPLSLLCSGGYCLAQSGTTVKQPVFYEDEVDIDSNPKIGTD